MPRTSSKRQTAVECAAHGQRCALYAGRGYRSDRCKPAGSVGTPLRQEVELFQMLEDAWRRQVAEREGITVAQVAERQEVERQAEQRRRARLSLSALDAEDRAVGAEVGRLLEQAKADSAAREAALAHG